MIRTLVQLTKPGIIAGNLITTLGGFFLASRGSVSFTALLCVIVGVSLVIASGCVLNNWFDRDIDALMKRTRHRPLVTGELQEKTVFVYATILGIAGLLLLGLTTNGLTVLLGITGLLIYVGAYTLCLKRNHPVSTEVGSISGAIPPLMGYVAVTDSLDLTAWLLFLLVVLWQMPHHYAITIYRLKDYRAANIPVLPSTIGEASTLKRITVYIAIFWLASLGLFIIGATGWLYLFGTTIINVIWLYTAYASTLSPERKARKLFFQSLWVISVHSLLMAISHF